MQVVDGQGECVVVKDSIRWPENFKAGKSDQFSHFKSNLVSIVHENVDGPKQFLESGIDGSSGSRRNNLDGRKSQCDSGDELDGIGSKNQALDQSKPPLECEGKIGSFSCSSTPMPKKS